MLGVEHPPAVIDSMLVPPIGAGGVRCISMGFFAKEDQPVIWRGPMLHKALEQFLTDVFWDDPDLLLVDLPPGTGDISLSLAQFLPNSRGLHRHHARSRPRSSVAQRRRVHGPEGEPQGQGRDREHELVHRATTASATSCSAPAAATSSPSASTHRSSARSRSSPSSAAGGDSGHPIVLTDPDRRGRAGLRPDRRAHRGRAGPHTASPPRAQAPVTRAASAPGRHPVEPRPPYPAAVER